MVREEKGFYYILLKANRRKKIVKVKEETHNIYQVLRPTINAFELEILEGISEEEQHTKYTVLKNTRNFN